MPVESKLLAQSKSSESLGQAIPVEKFSLRGDTRTRSQSITENALKHGLLVPCQSPLNTRILQVIKSNGGFLMV